MDGKELWRLTVFDAPLSDAEPDFLLRKMAGGAFPYEMLSVSPWDRRDYVAESYHQGRVFISGDAAHQCSPTGGIGMHTGLEEIVNLAWKLIAMPTAGAARLCLPPTRASVGRSRCAMSNTRPARTTRSPAFPELGATTPRLEQEPAALAVDTRASQVAILLRRLADLRNGRCAGARARNRAIRALDAARLACAACLACRRALDPRPVRRRLRAAAARRRPARHHQPDQSRQRARRAARHCDARRSRPCRALREAASSWCGRTAMSPGAAISRPRTPTHSSSRCAARAAMRKPASAHAAEHLGSLAPI